MYYTCWRLVNYIQLLPMIEILGNIIVHKLTLAIEQIRDIIHLSIKVWTKLRYSTLDTVS